MMMSKKYWLLVTVIIVTSLFKTSSVVASDEISITTKIANDYKGFYSKDRLLRLGIGFSTMGIIANTEIDDNFQRYYQDDIRSAATDNFSKTAKLFGEGKYLLPLSLLASGAYYLDSDSEIGNWGINSARAYAVGLPAVYLMQNITGASRPNESKGSQWRPFNDINGVSGHAFVGAVPFLTLARMNDNKVLKYAFYAASGLTAWSRVNDNSHYLSQAILGWYMAYEAVDTVFETNRGNFSITPVIANNYYGLSIQGTW